MRKFKSLNYEKGNSKLKHLDRIISEYLNLTYIDRQIEKQKVKHKEKLDMDNHTL